MTPLAFAAAFAIARKSLRAAYALVFGLAYILPVVFQAALGRFVLENQVPWLAAVFGVIAAQGGWTRWRLPSCWKLPLVYWALALAVVWPVLIAREADFHWLTMAGVVHINNTRAGAPPPVIAVMILNVALTYMLGILLFDGCFATFEASGEQAFRRIVVMPLAISFLLGAVVSEYQAFVDIKWLSAHAWPALGRAAGGLVDGDASGALAGFWSAPTWALAAASAAGFGIGGAAAAIAWAVVWASGSRMALLAGAIATAGVFVSAARSSRGRLPAIAAFAVACLAAGAIVLGHGFGSIDDPLHRTLSSLPSLSRQSLIDFVRIDLFDRHAPYGTASIAMVRQFPVTGVGVGNFYSLFADYAFSLAEARGDFDNAQSWYRHQLAELGIVGSLGWIWWVVVFGWLLVVTRGDVEHRFQAGALKSALVAVAVVSLVSMPTQVIPVSLTVWVFAFWYLSLARAVPQRPSWDRWVQRPMPWVALWMVAAVFLVETYRVARTEMRPPLRALAFDWDYRRGWHRPETAEGGASFRWTAEDEAVAVLPATGRYLKLTFWVNHPDVERNPVRVTISGMNREFGGLELHDTRPVTWYIRVPTEPVVPAGHRRMMIEARVSRMWRPSSVGIKDPRDLGVAVADWTFADQPPPGATTVE